MDFDQWITMTQEWFSKFPPLPANAKDILTKIAPWFALIFGILGVLGSVAAAGFLTALSPFVALGGGVGYATGGIVGALLMVVASVMLILAYPGLRDHKTAGWKYAFWSQTVNIIGSVIALNLLGAVISAIIGYYLLFQIKSYYK